jgi:uncharacterized protein YdeI (YjbR/CyaY-like superfamily)
MNLLHVTTREEWRAWLRANHRREKEVWLVSYKKRTGKPAVAYDDALDEALCFGWIDAMVRRIDGERYAQKYTPRQAKSTWSAANIERAKRLIRQRRMTRAGREALGDALETGPTSRTPSRDLTVPPDFARALRANKLAQRKFDALAPGYRRRYLGWINDAKRDETRRKRIAEAVAQIASGVKSLMK